MNAINSQGGIFYSPVIFNPTILAKKLNPPICSPPSPNGASGRGIKLRASSGDNGEKQTAKRSFLSLEEAGLVEMSGLSSHERFLCRLTISSLNLLRVISEQESCPIEELNAGKVCDWFLKDKLKREQHLDSAVLQWDDSEFLM